MTTEELRDRKSEIKNERAKETQRLLVMAAKKPRVLVSNDDGIFAPGLRSLVAALAASDVADIYVCSPSGELSDFEDGRGKF